MRTVRRISRSVIAVAVGFGLGVTTAHVTATRPGAETPCGWVLWMSTVTSTMTASHANIAPKKWTTVDATDSREACLTAAAQQIRALRVRQNVPEPAQESLDTAFSETYGVATSTSFVSFRCFPSETRPQ